jgi:hypothetical protein
MAAGSTERTSGYFGDQTPSKSKKPCFPSRHRFYHFWRTPLSQPLLDQSDQSARFYFMPTATPVTTAFFLEGGKQCIEHKLRSLRNEN